MFHKRFPFSCQGPSLLMQDCLDLGISVTESWHLSLHTKGILRKNYFILYEQYSEIRFYSNWDTYTLHVCTHSLSPPQEQKSSFLAAETACLILDCLIAKQKIRKSFTGFVLLSRDIFSNQACNCVTVMSNSDRKLLYWRPLQSCLPKVRFLQVVLSLEILHLGIKSWCITRFELSDWHSHLQIIFCNCLLATKLTSYYTLWW